MRLVYKFRIKENERLLTLCKVSKNLYNQALYLVKKELKDNHKWVGYSYLNKELQTAKNLEGEINYRLLKAQVSQQCLKTLDKNITSYVRSIKDYSTNKEKYKGQPKFPKYKRDVNQMIYTNQACTIKNGFIFLDKKTKIKIPQFDKFFEKLKKFQQVRIIPKMNKTFDVEIVYIDEETKAKELDFNSYASIDLGVDNIATMVLPNEKPILFNGRQVKAKNQYFNKKISKLQSELTNNKKTSKQIRNLYNKRDNQLSDIFHKLSRMIVNKLVSNEIGNIVVGYNKGWKDSINIGKRNNQTFVQISFDRFIKYLKYKCEMVGINLVIHEESYTSKCDALAQEEIKKHETYLGKRVKRGLFQSSIGKLINADVNGSLNILRKVVGDSEQVVRIINSGWLFQPLRVNILV